MTYPIDFKISKLQTISFLIFFKGRGLKLKAIHQIYNPDLVSRFKDCKKIWAKRIEDESNFYAESWRGSVGEMVR